MENVTKLDQISERPPADLSEFAFGIAQKTELSVTSATEILFNFFQPEKLRVDALKLLSGECTVEDVLENVSRLGSMLQMADTEIISNFFKAVIESDWVKPQIGYAMVIIYCSGHENDERYDSLHLFISKILRLPFEISLPVTQQVELIKLLMLSKTYKKQAVQYFVDYVIKNKTLSQQFVHRSILSLEKLNIPKKRVAMYMKESMYEFFNFTSDLRLQILAGQYLIHKAIGVEPGELTIIVKKLFEIGENEGFEENARADAMDVLLRVDDVPTKRESD